MREFADISAFLRYMSAMPAQMRLAGNSGLRDAAIIIETEAKAEIGHYQDAAGQFTAWKELADTTKEERVKLGFTENDPLLRTGEMRDSIGVATADQAAVVGSDSEVAVDQELGTSRIPARSFLGGAAVRKTSPAVDVAAGSVVRVLAGLPRGSREFTQEALSEESLRDIPF